MITLFIAKVYAQGITNPVLTDGEVAAGQGATRLGKIVSSVIGVFFLFGMIMAFIHLLFGAFMWISAGGDKSKMENARNRITEAIVGLVVLAAVWAIMQVASFFLGVGSFTDQGWNLILPSFSE